MGHFYSFSFVAIVISSVLFGMSRPLFAESCNSTTDMKQTSQNILQCIKPQCFANEGFQDKSKDAEDVLKDKLSAVSGEESVLRLIFSEMLASNCTDNLSNENLQQMGQGIAQVINQRVLNIKQNKTGFSKEKAVVFAKTQFRSSTGGCDVAKREEFLCPTKNPNWEKIWKLAQSAWTKVTKQKATDNKVLFYYFPKHFDNSKNCSKYKEPEVFQNWKKGKVEVPAMATTKELSECIRFFQ